MTKQENATVSLTGLAPERPASAQRAVTEGHQIRPGAIERERRPSLQSNAITSPGRSFWIIIVAMVIVYMTGSVPTPLYPVYQKLFDASSPTMAIIFSAFVAGLFLALVTLGGLSDVIGRRPILIIALLAAVLGSLLFAFADGAPELVGGRFLHGIAVGAFTGAATAKLVELAPRDGVRRGSLALTSASSAGLGLGGLWSGEMFELGASPAATWYTVIALLICTGLLLLLVRPDERKQQEKVHLQAIRVPREIRARFWANALGQFCLQAIGVLFLATLPSLLQATSISAGLTFSGQLVGVFFFASLGMPFLAIGLPARLSAACGLASMALGLSVLVWALSLSSVVVCVAGAFLASIGDGLSFVGTVADVNHVAPPERRSEVLSALLVAGYVGFAVPTVAIGTASTYLGIRMTMNIVAGLIVPLTLFAAGRVFRTGGDDLCRDFGTSCAPPRVD